MPKSYKVMIDHEVYNALKAEALFRNLSLKDTLAGLVLKNISPEAQKVLKLLRDKKDSKAQNGIEPQEDLETHVERKSYSKDISAIATTKEGLKSGKPIQQIAKELGYERSTISMYIRRHPEDLEGLKKARRIHFSPALRGFYCRIIMSSIMLYKS